MKNQREIYEALLAGETLVNVNTKSKILMSPAGFSAFLDTDPCDVNALYANEWQIYKEPKWYENIPDGGVLCWVKDTNTEKSVIREIDKHNSTDKTTYPFINSNTSACWKQAQPLTKSEIQVFMDNAPEDL